MLCFIDSMLEELEDALVTWGDMDGSGFDDVLHRLSFESIFQSHKHLMQVKTLLDLERWYMQHHAAIEIGEDDETVD
jgi:hypothetical protein